MKDTWNRIRGPRLAGLLLCLAACNPQQSVTPVDGNPISTQRAANDSMATPIEVLSWGPRSTTAGIPFNIQVDGNSGISFQLNKRAPAGDYIVTLDGRPLTGVVVSGELVTATIPAEYLARPGTFPLVVQNTTRGKRLMSDQFTVEAP